MTTSNAILPIPASHGINDYSELKSLIKQSGLLEKQPLYYINKMILLFIMLALSIAILLFVKPFWLQLFNAALLAIVTTQFGLLGHAAGHRQIFRTTWKNDIVGLITGNLFVGISHQWWMERHNKHHSHPNEHDIDPDVFIPIIAFAPEDLHGKGKFLLSMMRYQAYFFFPMLTLASIEMQRTSVQYLFQTKVKYAVTERVLLVLHFVLYFAFLFYCLPFWQAILFILAHQILSGVYMGSIFAPNHKGMPVLEKNSQMDFLHRQVITARNVHAHPVTDFWYGGLNYQIEHHLFPAMPQNKLRRAQAIVRTFCQEQAIPYYETNLLQSYRETVSALHAVTAPLREASRRA